MLVATAQGAGTFPTRGTSGALRVNLCVNLRIRLHRGGHDESSVVGSARAQRGPRRAARAGEPGLHRRERVAAGACAPRRADPRRAGPARLRERPPGPGDETAAAAEHPAGSEPVGPPGGAQPRRRRRPREPVAVRGRGSRAGDPGATTGRAARRRDGRPREPRRRRRGARARRLARAGDADVLERARVPAAAVAARVVPALRLGMEHAAEALRLSYRALAHPARVRPPSSRQPTQLESAYTCSTGTPRRSRATDAQSRCSVSSTAWGAVMITTSSAPACTSASRAVT